jgi:hypothetical protein
MSDRSPAIALVATNSLDALNWALDYPEDARTVTHVVTAGAPKEGLIIGKAFVTRAATSHPAMWPVRNMVERSIDLHRGLQRISSANALRDAEEGI